MRLSNKTASVANTIIYESSVSFNKYISNMKLQKLFYFSFGNHLRLQHRLQTARFTVWGGGVAIVVLTLISFFIPAISEEGQPDVSAIYEILRTSIATLASIVTLALGYIAGSNIDNN